VIAAGLIPTAAYALTALMTAAMNEDIEAIKIMAKEQINPNVIQDETGYTALHHAVIARKYRSVLAILNFFTDESSLHYGCKRETKERHSSFISSSAGYVQGDSALHLAIR
jgi:ankyrin repeat protein